MIPFLEKKSYLDIEQFNVDVVTSDFVPTLDFINVKADAVVKAKIGTTPDMIAAAAQNFLGWKTKDIADSVRDVLEGNLREIIGKMDLNVTYLLHSVNREACRTAKTTNQSNTQLARIFARILSELYCCQPHKQEDEHEQII